MSRPHFMANFSIAVETFHLKTQMSTWWCSMKSQGITKVSRHHLQGTMNVCPKYNCDPFNSWDMRHFHMNQPTISHLTPLPTHSFDIKNKSIGWKMPTQHVKLKGPAGLGDNLSDPSHQTQSFDTMLVSKHWSVKLNFPGYKKQWHMYVDIFQQCIFTMKKKGQQTNTQQKSTGIVPRLTFAEGFGTLNPQTVLWTRQLPFGFGCKAIRQRDCVFCVTTVHQFNI